MRALVISGGSAKGAFAGGVAEYLINHEGINYDMVLGTSTGSLLAPLLSIGKIEPLKRVYSETTNDDIFSKSPLKVRKKRGKHIVGINHWNIIRMFLNRQATFGDSTKLKDSIRRIFSEQDYHQILSENKKVIITVSNLSLNLVEYKYIQDCSYEEFVDWMWIGCNVVPFMSLAVRKGFEYADGGFGNLIPIREAIDAGATELDVIILQPKHQKKPNAKSTNPFATLFKTFDFMVRQTGGNDVYISYLEAQRTGIKINYYYTPRLLSEHYFVFDKEQMTKWWQEGYEWAAKKILMRQNR